MRSRRSAFTLIELLIVVGILLILTMFVVAIFKPDGANKMRDGARITQSAFLGARDRALHAFSTTKIASPGNRRGVRLMRDTTDPYLITSFAYVQPIDVTPPLQYGVAVANGEVEISTGSMQVLGTNVDWDRLSAFGAFPYPARIKIPAAANGEWYTYTNISVVPMSNPKQVTLSLTTACNEPVGPTTCEFELGNELLPNHQPIPLPSGLVIDLYNSKLPALWTSYQSISKATQIPSGWVSLGEDPKNTANNLIALASLDIMFSPRGALTGAAAGTGPIYLLLNTIDDATLHVNPADPANKGDKLILAISPLTGHVQTYPVDLTDVLDNSNGASLPAGDKKADNLYRYAKQGSAAGQ